MENILQHLLLCEPDVCIFGVHCGHIFSQKQTLILYLNIFLSGWIIGFDVIVQIEVSGKKLLYVWTRERLLRCTNRVGELEDNNIN